MNQAVRIYHPLGKITLRPASGVTARRLEATIRTALDRYAAEGRVPAEALHAMVRKRLGNYYRTPGYYLRVYRNRAELTQARLAGKAGILQHHVSEMEHNRRPMGKALARKLAKISNCEYQRLL